MILILMGVSGSGKSTVGGALAAALGWRFEDADDLHPPANVEKMERGVGLSDEDRAGWLEAVAKTIEQHDQAGRNVIIACSALRRRYRERLREAATNGALCFVFLHGDREVLRARLEQRRGHFAGASLLPSQLETLERPAADEPVIEIDINQDLPEIVQAVRHRLDL